MSNLYGFVTVRTNSSRLPSKCFLKFGEQTIIESIFERANLNNITPILCTSSDSIDDKLIEIANKRGYQYFRGSMNNKIKRWYECANNFSIEKFHTIDGDDPFFDPRLILNSLSLLNNEQIDLVKPSDYSMNGAASVGYSIRTKILKKIVDATNDNTDTEMIEKFLNIDKARIAQVEEIDYLDYQIRLTLDYIEDYEILNFIYRELGPIPERTQIIEFFKKNPSIHKYNFFRNIQWKQKQFYKLNN